MKQAKYSDYKNSGIDWIGEIPSHWEVRRVKSIFRLVAEPAHKNNDFELLSLYTDIGVKPRKDLAEKGNKASTTDGYWHVKKGDIVVNKLLAWMGAIGVSDYNGVTSPAYDILRAYKPIESNYYHRLFRTKRCVSELRRHSRGIMDMRLRLYFDKLGNIKIPYPPLSEQQAIADYLDRKCGQIDQAVAQKQQLFALLKERKQIMIQQAVTKGLNPKALMKDSGIDWIGEIPEGWEVKRLRYIGTTQNGISAGAEYFGSGFPFVSYGNVYNNKALPKEVKGLANSSLKEQKNYSVIRGDVFFTRTSESIEEIGFASTCLTTIEKATFAGFLIRFRPKKSLLEPSFSKYYFSSVIHRNFFVKEVNLVIRASLSQELLKRLPVLLPPLPEQKAIVAHIEAESAKIDKALGLQEKQITKLKEYKQVLINSAVTGKVKVLEV
jgi:type I restriction enzyme S subunit